MPQNIIDLLVYAKVNPQKDSNNDKFIIYITTTLYLSQFMRDFVLYRAERYFYLPDTSLFKQEKKIVK